MASLTVSQIAELCHTGFEGDGDRLITGANALEDAGPSEISFVASKRAVESAGQSSAGCLIVPHGFLHQGDRATIAVEHPRAVFAHVLSVLYATQQPQAFHHATAVLDPTAEIGADVIIGAHAVIGARTSIGARCRIGNGCVLGDDVSVGEDTILHANVTVYARVQLGRRVIAHSGCVIGADGFGFARVGPSYQKFPQVGTVVIGDDVELGANTCVDRAALGKTVIGEGSKIDNLVHIAHNVQVGRHVVIAAQTGFSGGVTVGDGAIIGGQVGIGDKAIIESNAIVGSGSGILTGARARAGEPLWGTPARPLRQHLKGLAHVSRLSEYRTELKELKRRVDGIESESPKTKNPN